MFHHRSFFVDLILIVFHHELEGAMRVEKIASTSTNTLMSRLTNNCNVDRSSLSEFCSLALDVALSLVEGETVRLMCRLNFNDDETALIESVRAMAKRI